MKNWKPEPFTVHELAIIDNMFLRDLEAIRKLDADSSPREKLRAKVFDILNHYQYEDKSKDENKKTRIGWCNSCEICPGHPY